MQKSALIIVGNEILSGRTQDKNIQHIGEKMALHGVPLAEVRVVPDIEDRIVEAVNTLRPLYEFVFTTGGLGPTHDDITAACIAKAFGVELEQNKEAYKELEKHYGTDELTTARLKMAQMPVGAQLIDNPVSGAPGFFMENVYTMAGIPRIMQAMLDDVLNKIEDGDPVISKSMIFDMPESVIAERLGSIQHKFPDVEIGSYPNFRNGKLWTCIVMRATDETRLDEVFADVEALMVG